MEQESPTEEQVQELKAELQKSLGEEQMLLSLEMQLMLQLEKLDAAILKSESEERLAKLAYQQALVSRLMKKKDSSMSHVDDEPVTIQIRS